MAISYQHIETSRVIGIETVPGGTDMEIKDWDDSVVEQPAVHLWTHSDGFVLEGSRKELIRILETALEQARALPGDPQP